MGIIISEIRKSYGRKQVLKGASIEASFGQCVGILGGNGSGKSTFLSILAGVQRADGGVFLWEDEKGQKNLFKEKTFRQRLVGYAPQGTPLLEELTAKDNLLLWYSKEELERELRSGALAMLGIPDFIRTPANKMSGGMRKRLCIGCAVAGSPQILLLDEPAAALDLAGKERLGNYLKEYREKGGIILLATHDVQELELCDKLVVLKDGMFTPCQYQGNVHRLIGAL